MAVAAVTATMPAVVAVATAVLAVLVVTPTCIAHRTSKLVVYQETHWRSMYRTNASIWVAAVAVHIRMTCKARAVQTAAES